MFAIARTFALIGVTAEPVHVEVDIGAGLPSFTIVGLPDAAVRESRERVRSALVNSGFRLSAAPDHRQPRAGRPAQGRAGLRSGDRRRVARGLGAAVSRMPRSLVLAGELALDGSIRPVPGALAMAEAAVRWGMRGVAVAPGDAAQAALVGGTRGGAGRPCRPGCASWGGRRSSPSRRRSRPLQPDPSLPDLADLRGHPALRRCLEIAAAGAHSLLLIGPPGGGKSLALQRLPSLLPPAQPERGDRGDPDRGRLRARTAHLGCSGRFALRTTRSRAAPWSGAGRRPGPGEVTRAHRGVLFLDELGEFRRDALEALRVPLEEGVVTVTRTSGTVSLPCRFMLIAASNPCPCGNGPDSGECDCHPSAVAKYMAKLSGALADRIDMTMTVVPPPPEELADDETESSATVRERVIRARRAPGEAPRRRPRQRRDDAERAPSALRAR